MSEVLTGGGFLGAVVRSREFAGIVLNETRYPARSALRRHCHEHAYLCLILAGTYQEDYGRSRRSCGPRMLAFHPAEEDHAEHFEGTEVRSFNVELSPSWLRRTMAPCAAPFDTTDAPAVGLAMRMYEEFSRPDASSPLIIEGLLLQLLGLASREARSERSAPRWLLRVRDLVADRCTCALTLAELAEEAEVHPGHLAATFRRHFGCTVGAYARRERVAAACRRLTETEASLAEIAIATGFADQSHLTRQFRVQVGLTPAAYRKMAGISSSRSKT